MFSTQVPHASTIQTARRIALCFSIAALALLAPRLQGQSCQLNAIACENQLTGNAASEWDISGAGDSSLQGFATSISVNKGETVHFKVDTTYPTFQVNIYRLGYYGGRGARKIATLGSFAGTDQAPCLTNAATGLVDCGNWLESATWAVPATAVSGIYLARLSSTSGGASHIVFVVRDDAAQADLLFQTSDTTWQAYNQYGGNSLYVGGPGSNPGRAYKVSYNRPFTTRGTGPEDWLFNAEYPMVRFLEANGYNVSYSTGVDTDRSGATELFRHRIFLSVGHDEYWSGPQRTNVEAARNGGVHLAFFSGNEVFWKTRWESSIDGTATPYRTLVSYKETHANAKLDPADPPTWTGTWRDPRFSPPADGGRPENALTGTIFTVNCCNDTQTLRVTQAFASQPFWRNTRIATLAAGASTTLTPGMLGYEWDENLNNGSRPAGLVTLSSTAQSVTAKLQDNGSTYASGSATHSLVEYRHPSGALVFGAGTVQYSWGLDSTHDRGSAAADKAVQQATVNLFADMGGIQPATLQSGLVPGIADTAAPTVTMTAPADGATVSGSITVSATATDNVGVAGVQFQLDGTNFGTEVTASPFSVTWNTTSAANGSHTLKAVARDTAGHTATSTAVSVSVSNTALPPPTGLAIDAVAFGDRSTISTSIATSAFSTAGSNELLLAFVAADDTSAGGQQVTTVAGAALTWQLVVRSKTQRGASEIWRAFSPSTLSGAVVTATLAQSAAASITVITVSGADTSGSNGSGAIGAIKAASGASGAPTATLVSTRNNSWVFAVGNDWDNTSARTVGTGQTMVHQYLATVGDTFWVQRATSTTPSSGTTVTVNDTAPTADQYNLALCEIVPAAAADTTLPTVAITAPAAGASVSGSGVTLSATAADNVAVVGVQFKIDGVAQGAEDTTAPYSTIWDTTAVVSGQHTLTASARDAAGNVAVSSPVIVTVSNDTTPPSVNLTTPTAGAVVSGAIVLSANATDNTGVAGVQFKLDSVNFGAEVATLPYSINWDTQTAVNGTHTLTATARDAAGNTTTSAPVTVVTQNTSTIPSVAITSPLNGAAVSGTITVTAGAFDPGGIAGVQFSVDGVDVGAEQSAAPYSISFTAISGAHILTAVARNTQGVTATSAQVNVTASAGTTSAVTANGLQTFQTIDGIGVNINSLSWKNGELRPAIDMLADQMGVTSWRVVFDMVDWESQNDNADPNVSDATYYNALYSNQKFQNLWGTLHYLNQKGITHNVTLSFMGRVPTWMGGSVINTASEDEFVETISSLLAYARNTEHVVFDMVDPINEPDLDGIEGPQVNATQYTRILRKLATKLDAMALNDIKFLSPNVAHSDAGVSTYIPAMLADSVVMAKVDHFALHDYSATTSGADAAVKSSNRNFWMTEFALPSDVTSFLAANASGLMIWEAYDSVYNHAILAGRGTVAPNDDAFAPALIAYDNATGVYTPRAMFYQFAQLARYVPSGSIRVGTTGGASGVTLFAFYHAATGRITVFGRNITASSVPLTITLANLAPASVMQTYETTLTTNFVRGRDAVVSNGTLFYTAPVNSYFTLTNLALSSVPTVTVPAVVGLPQANATTAITDAGLGVGTVSTQASASVAIGAVISQTPAANSQVLSGTSVNLIISTGPSLVTVPAVIGVPQASATAAIVNAGLVVGTITTQASTTVAVGSVIGQSLAANTQAIAGSAVDLIVSVGVTVPSVVGQPQSAATTMLTAAGLIAGAVTNQASASVAAGAVISQSPVANTQVSGGSAVNLVVSTGPAPITVPSVVGLLQAAATTSITNASLVVGTASTQASTTVAVGVVVSQSPAGGTQTVAGSAVNIVVSSGVSVPAVVGLQQSAATTALTAAGLIVGTVTSQSSASVAAGAVISQSPAANTQASGGSAVNLVVSSGPAPAGPIVDATVFSDGSGTQTTPAFNTTAAGDVLLAFGSSDGPSAGAQTLTISGAGLTWTLVRRSNVRAGTSEIWQAKAVGQLANVTVQSSQSAAGYRQSLTVVAFRGATGIGASAIANGASGAPSVSLTTTKANSLVYAVGNDWDSATARTLGTGQAMVHQSVDSATGDTYWVQTRSAAAPVGTAVQLNDTAPTADRWNFASVEIVP